MRIFDDNGQVSLEKINDVEKLLGYSFPTSYVKLIKEHDALSPIENIFDFINIYNKSDERDLNFLSFKSNHLDRDMISNQDNVNDLDNYGIKDLVVFGICANGDYVCFDYRDDVKGTEPKIVLVYHDDFINYEDGTSTMVVNHVAENFEDFLNILHE